MRRMYDVLFLPNPTPAGYDVAAGYVASVGISRPWSADDWTRAKTQSRYLLPIVGGSIYAGSNPQLNPRADVDAALALAPTGYPNYVAYALDVESNVAQHAADSGYVDSWCHFMEGRGAVPVVYCSGSTAHLFPGKRLWIAHWTNTPHMEPGSVATQYASPTSTNGALHVDESLVSDVLPLWDTRPAPSPPEGVPDMYVLISTKDNRPARLIGADHNPKLGPAHFAIYVKHGYPPVLDVDGAEYDMMWGQLSAAPTP